MLFGGIREVEDSDTLLAFVDVSYAVEGIVEGELYFATITVD